MITRLKTRPQALLQAFVTPVLSSARQQCRFKHTVPALLGNKDEVFKKHGVPGFLSADTYNETWLKYQTHLCNYLDENVQGTTYEGLGVKDLHETLSRQPANASLYNYAAQAHHNHFFWNTLSASEATTEPSKSFRSDVEEWYESFDHLRDEMLDSAMSFFGNGYVWLMKDLHPSCTLRILCTYNVGSPYPGAHTRQQSFDHSTGTDLSAKLTRPQQLQRPQNRVGAFGNQSENAAVFRPGQLVAMPILCLKVWEHQWLPDYGILGKEAYVRNWWDHVDWDQVLNIYNMIPDDTSLLHGSLRRLAPTAATQNPLGRITQQSMNRAF